MVTAGSDIDYTDTLKRTFGKKGFYLGMCTYIMVLMIPITIFFQLLSQFLYPIILVTLNINKDVNFDLDFKSFSYSYTCIIVFIYLNILTNRRDM